MCCQFTVLITISSASTLSASSNMMKVMLLVHQACQLIDISNPNMNELAVSLVSPIRTEGISK